GRFPQGIADVAAHVHGNGQRFGLYTVPGLWKEAYDRNTPIEGTSCHARDIAARPLRNATYFQITWKIDYSKPCAQAYVDSIAEQLDSWGADFLKIDSVAPGSLPRPGESYDSRADVAAWDTALRGKGIWLTLSWSLD